MSLSVYIHVPFCIRRCSYCAFYSGEPLDLLPHYPSLIRAEAFLRSSSPACSPSPASTVYFGGGTPSLLGLPAISHILESVGRHWGILSDAEVTLEVNPGDTLDFSLLRDCGVNRISIGVQSLDDAILRRLGRRHSALQALGAVLAATRAGLRTSADILFGLPAVHPDSLASTIARLRASGVEHVSTYSLEVHPGTPLADMERSGLSQTATSSEEEDQWVVLDTALRSQGLFPYEVSNYCLPHAESRHNLAYWSQVPYLGLGPGAHSYDPSAPPWGTRSWNDPGISEYAGALARSEFPPGGREELTPRDALLEALFLRLRRPEPFDLGALSEKFGLNAVPSRGRLDQACQEGLLIPSPEDARVYAPSPRGTRTADGLALWLLDRPS